jgi:transcriptional regulator GlxA family with amidase domain/YHS domain-containing protein
MKRRALFQSAAALTLASALPARAAGESSALAPPVPLEPPHRGLIPVAFLVSEGAVVIDFCGPWEVFQDASFGDGRGFQLYTVAASKKPIRASGGLQIIPDHDFSTAPAPKVVVIPAQQGESPAALEWIRKVTATADLTMSVCTGAFLLAKTGLLAGKAATTHHDSFRLFAMDHPEIQLKRGARFVESGNLATAGGLSSGIDLALRVVERYFGREAASSTAYHMEYQGQGWMRADSNAVYARTPKAAPGHELCPVCWMDVDPAHAVHAAYKGKTYWFCMGPHQRVFEASPERFLDSPT